MSKLSNIKDIILSTTDIHDAYIKICTEMLLESYYLMNEKIIEIRDIQEAVSNVFMSGDYEQASIFCDSLSKKFKELAALQTRLHEILSTFDNNADEHIENVVETAPTPVEFTDEPTTYEPETESIYVQNGIIPVFSDQENVQEAPIIEI